MIIWKNEVNADTELANEMERRRTLLRPREKMLNSLTNGAIASMAVEPFTEKDQAILDAAEVADEKLQASNRAAKRCNSYIHPVEIDEALPHYKSALKAVKSAIEAREGDCESSPLLKMLKNKRDELERAIRTYTPKGGLLLSEYDEQRAQREREAKEAAAAIKAAEAEERAQALKDAQDAAIAEREAKEERVRRAYETVELD